jgi:hypothetical protein
MGERAKKVSDHEMLRVIALDPHPVVTASGLVEKVDYVSEAGVRNRLRDLHDKNYLDKLDVGARATVWYLTKEGRFKLDELEQGTGDN